MKNGWGKLPIKRAVPTESMAGKAGNFFFKGGRRRRAGKPQRLIYAEYPSDTLYETERLSLSEGRCWDMKSRRFTKIPAMSTARRLLPANFRIIWRRPDNRGEWI